VFGNNQKKLSKALHSKKKFVQGQSVKKYSCKNEKNRTQLWARKEIRARLELPPPPPPPPFKYLMVNPL